MSDKPDIQVINHTLLPRLAETEDDASILSFPRVLLARLHRPAAPEEGFFIGRTGYTEEAVENMVRNGRATVIETAPCRTWNLVARHLRRHSTSQVS